MRNVASTLRRYCLVLAIASITGCGGGSSDSSTDETTQGGGSSSLDGKPLAVSRVAASDATSTNTIRVTFAAPNQSSHCTSVSYVIMRKGADLATLTDIPLSGAAAAYDDVVGGSPQTFEYKVKTICSPSTAEALSDADTGTNSTVALKGIVAPIAASKTALVYAYNAQGRRCSNLEVQLPNSENGQINYQQYAVTDTAGNYVFTVDPSRCGAPIVLHADIPDGNDAADILDSPTREGRKYFNFLSELLNGITSYELNLNPATAVVTTIVAGRVPSFADTNPSTIYNEARRQSASTKLAEGIDKLAASLGLSVPDYSNPTFDSSSALSKVFSVVNTSVERIPTSRQTIIRFHLPSEHRPLALVLTDGSGINESLFDPGLGVAVELVSEAEFKKAQAVQAELDTTFASTQVLAVFGALDSCYQHNGHFEPYALVGDVPGWEDPTSKVENLRLLRLNTYADFSNETLEFRNTGPATLAFVSFDYRNIHGLKQRAYTWMIKGQQPIQRCSVVAGSPDQWRFLGNQRPVYLRTDTIAVHEISFSQGFGTRKDTFGSGTEHWISNPSYPVDFTHVLVNGPGLPSDGVLFIQQFGTYLLSTTSLKALRQAAVAGEASGNANWFKAIANTIKDTRAYMMTDVSIRTISDTYFDFRQNGYVYRYFSNYTDLFPSFTFQDTLPKRPYLSAEIPVDYFHTVGVNIDNLVQSMQRLDPVDINWSLPKDNRGYTMIPRKAWFTRMNCTVPKSWPLCLDRTTQYNEYDLAPVYFPIPSTGDMSPTHVTITPWPFPIPDLLTNKAYARVLLLDSLNRPIETRFGMDYTR